MFHSGDVDSLERILSRVEGISRWPAATAFLLILSNSGSIIVSSILVR